MALHDLAGMTSLTTGTGTLTLAQAIPGFLSFPDAGILSDETISYSIRDGLDTEVGIGLYNSTGPTLTRITVKASTNNGNKIVCTGKERVFLTAIKSDFPIGWMPYAYQTGYVISGTIVTGLNLAADGGTLAIPIQLSAPMSLQSVSLWNTNTATARKWGWDLYVHYANDGLSSQKILTRIAYSDADESFTPSAASLRTSTANNAPILLSSGLYWLAIQNRHVTSTFDIGAIATNAFTMDTAQINITTNPNGTTLDFETSWTMKNDIYCIRLNGCVFGMTSEF